jgi:hypothetical protein
MRLVILDLQIIPLYYPKLSGLSFDNSFKLGYHANFHQQPFFGAMGCTSAIVFTCFGAAYGTAKSGVGISAMGVLRPDLIVKSTSTIRYEPIPMLDAKIPG